MKKKNPMTGPDLKIVAHDHASARPAEVKKSKKPKSNRIFELMKARHWTYAEVAERIRALAKARKIEAYGKVHEVTINRLALGKAKLTQDWMKMLGEIFQVPAHELIATPAAQNLIVVHVTHVLDAGIWRGESELPEPMQFDVMIPNDPLFQNLTLYAGEIKGPSFNLRYPEKTIVVLSRIEQKPGEIVEGKRYHVRATRDDGLFEDSIKSLSRDGEGRYWLKPESDHPAHQGWLPLGGTDGLKVEIVGRVRGVFYRED